MLNKKRFMYLKGLNFVAIDFETANHLQMACQVGITVVIDGEIKETITKLIQPPGNQYDVNFKNVHHITEDMTKNMPTFDVVWQEISQYFIGTTLVAHQKSADETILYKNLDYYGIMSMGIKKFLCTYQIYNRGLEELCAGFHIDFSNHHDAGFDSFACAQFYINYNAGIEPDLDAMNKYRDEIKNTKIKRDFGKHERICGDVLKKDLSGADPNNPFYDRKVVITGTFSFDRRDLAIKLKKMGADVDTGITKKTNYVIIGDDPGYAKIEKLEKLLHDGYTIRKLSEMDIMRIFAGEAEDFLTEKEVRKDLDFSYEHYSKNHIGWNPPTYNVEMFWGKGFRKERFCIYQITGNYGNLGNWELSPDIQVCVLSDSTIEKLKLGIKDETIKYIENYYNKDKSTNFSFKFLSESDIISYCRENYSSLDTSTKYYYDIYINSPLENN